MGGHVTSIRTYHVDPADWIKFLVSEDISLLADAGHPGSNFEAFWKAVKLRCPGHQVFQLHSGEALQRVVPLCIHGDEGRSQKKSPYLVVSMESAIGAVPRLKPACDCLAYMQRRPDLPQFGISGAFLDESTLGTCSAMYTNYRGHSYLSRHLLFGLRNAVYKENPHVVEKLLEAVVEGFRTLLSQGVKIPGFGTYYGAVLGCKGDMDWHVKSYSLDRCYSRVQTRSGEGMICHACHASTGTNSTCPFDDLTDNPLWAQTLYRTRPFSDPWPILASLPAYQDAPEQIIVPDPLHVVKLGIARDLIGGIILVLLRKGFFDYEGSSRNLKDRLQRAHSSFTFCAVSKLHPALRGFTKKWLHLQSFMSAPWCNSKASDSMILLRWLLWLVKLNLKQPVVPGFSQDLLIMARTIEAMLGIFRILHTHGLFLSRPCGSRLYVEIMRTLRGYRKLGKNALAMRIRAFILKPKCHSLHHIGYNLKLALQEGHDLVLSPEAESCEPNEDFIGRVSRLSRRVRARCMDLRVFQRYFYKKRALLNKRHASRS